MQILEEMVGKPPETGGVPTPGVPDFAAAKERIFGSRRKSSKVKEKKADAEAANAEEINKLFAGENWEELSALYFNARFALTGWDGFLLTEGQKKTLGSTLGKSMQLLLKIDPGYIAGVVWLTTFGGIVVEKELVYSRLKKEADKKEAERGDAGKS